MSHPARQKTQWRRVLGQIVRRQMFATRVADCPPKETQVSAAAQEMLASPWVLRSTCSWEGWDTALAEQTGLGQKTWCIESKGN